MKLFVSDLDGTLFKNGEELSFGCNEANKMAIQKWIAAGNHFAIATARLLAMKDEIFNEIGTVVNIIGSNGAEVYLVNGKSYTQTIEAELVNEIRKLAIEKQWDATMFYIGEDLYHIDENRYPFIGCTKQHSFADFSKRVTEIESNKQLFKAVLSMNPDQRELIKQTLKDHYGDQLSFVSSDIDSVDIGSLNCSKGTGVIHLAKYLNISPEHIITIGDSENDVSMFEVAHTSYCMAQGDDEVKNKATYVVNTVAEAIEIELNKL